MFQRVGLLTWFSSGGEARKALHYNAFRELNEGCTRVSNSSCLGSIKSHDDATDSVM